MSDQYPYDGAATASLTGIIVAPDVEGLGVFRRMGRQGRTEEGMAQLKAALGDPDTRALLKEASENGINGGFAWLKATSYTSMRITSSSDYPELVGVYLSEIAEMRGQDPFDAVADLIIGASQPVNLTLGAIKEHDVRRLLVQPWNMTASDGGYADGSESPAGHPRSAGTFPRLLGHYVRDEGVLPLEEAVRKITSLPAGLSRHERPGPPGRGNARGRGDLRPGDDHRPVGLGPPAALFGRRDPCAGERCPCASQR